MSEPTIALYYQDDYLREMEAALLSAGDGDVVLDRTVFYPRGGNQDCDTGTLSLAAKEGDTLRVREVVKDEQGTIHHHVDDGPPATWQPGAAVRGSLNWERRLSLMRLHTAQHMISRWFIDREGNGTGRVDITEHGCVIELERPVALESALDCVAEINRMIRQGRPVRRLNTSGYIEIVVDDFDRQPCGGTHVADVAEIGRVALLRHKQNRLEIAAGQAAEEAERLMSAAILRLLGPLETDLAGFGARAGRLLAEQREARAELFALREEVARFRIASAATGADGGRPVAIDLQMVEAKGLPRLLKPVQGPGRVFVCLCAGRNLVVVSGAPDAPANILVERVKANWGLSGGGSPSVAMCGPLPQDVTLDAVLALTTTGQ